jgi:hypothetical protein
MKFLLALLFFVLAHCSHAQSQTGSDILQSAIDNLPPCAVCRTNQTNDHEADYGSVQLQCTLLTVGSSTCELTDFDCIKNNKELLNDLTACVKSSCSIREALSECRYDTCATIGADERSCEEIPSANDGSASPR